MKRIWFAIVFIVLCVGICIFDQVSVKTTHDELEKRINIAQIDSNERNINEIISYYASREKLLFALCESNSVTDMSNTIYALSPELDNTSEHLLEIEAVNDSFYDAEKITLQNIF